MRFIGVAAIVLSAYLPASGQRADTTGDNQPVLRVGGTPVTVQEFRDRLNLTPHPGQFPDVAKRKYALAESIIAEKVLAAEARRRGFDTLYAARLTAREMEKEAVYEQWMSEEVLGGITISDAELRAAYRRFRERRTVRYLVFPDSAPAGRARAAIARGADIDALSSPDGPLTKTIDYAEALPEVEDIVFGLKVGEVSRVVRVDREYYVFTLQSVEPHPEHSSRGPAYWKPAVEKRIRARKAAHLLDERTAALLRARSFTINRNSLAFVREQIARRLPFGERRAPELLNAELAAVPGDIETRMGEQFVHFADGSAWTIGDVWTNLRFGPYLLNYRSKEEFTADFNNLLRQMVVFESIVEQGYRRGYQKTAYVSRESRMWEDDMLSRMLQTSLEGTIRLSGDDVVQWYNAHAGEYVRPEMRRVQVITTPDRSLAERLVDSLRSGAGGADLIRRHPAGDSGLPLDSLGSLWVTGRGGGEIGARAFLLKQGGVFGPFALDTTRLAVIKLLEVRPAEALPFASVADRARVDATRMRARRELDTLIERNVARTPVLIRRDLLDGIEAIEGNLVARKTHFPNRVVVPGSIAFDPDASWFTKILANTH